MTKLTHEAQGTFAIAPTPFHDDGRIDEKSIDRLTDFYGEIGCDGITVLGIMGEAPKLDGAEAEEIAKRFVKRAKNMQIIVGVSAPGFAAMRSLARASMDAGAAGVMIAPPPTLRTDDQITGYFKQAVEAIGADIPWVLQDYPLTLSVVFTPAVLYMVSDLSGDQTGKVLGVSGPRGVREMRMMEMDGWKPPFTGWKAEDIVTHASEIFFSEEEIKKSARRF